MSNLTQFGHIQIKPNAPPDSKNQRHQFLNICLVFAIIFAIAITASVFIGMRGLIGDNKGIFGWITPILTSAIIGLGLGILWHLLLKVAATVDVLHEGKFWTVICFAFGLTGLTYTTTAPFLASTIGGSIAQEVHQAEALEGLNRATNATVLRSKYLERVRGALTTEQSSINRLLEGEIDNGRVSGKGGGKGPIADEINNALTLIGNIIQRHNGVARNIDSDIAQVRVLVAEARSASRAGDARAFEEAYEAARVALVAVMGQDIAGIAGGFDYRSHSLDELRAVDARIRAATRITAREQAGVELPEYVAFSPTRAVIAHAESVPIAWTLAIVADSLMLVLLLILMGSSRLWANKAGRNQG